MNNFALELAKQIEKLAVDEGKDVKECIEAGIDLLKMQMMKQKKQSLWGGIDEF